MKKIISMIITILMCFCISYKITYADNTQQYNETKNSVDQYIDEQLQKVNLGEIEQYIDEDIFKEVDLKVFLKDLINGEKNLLDLFNEENLKMFMFKEIRSSLKVAVLILILALISSILKSLDNSFSSGAISQTITYIVFIVIVSFTLVNFKDVLDICFNSINSMVGLMKVIVPILIAFLVLIGFPITSTTINPIVIGGIAFIDTIFKNFITVTITTLFAILIVNSLSKNVKLNKFAKLIKQINIVGIGAIFTVYLGLIAMQSLYVTSIDTFGVKTAKFALGNFIPVVGGFVSDSVDILLSSSQLIKNVFGGVSLIILIGICLIPIIKVVSIIIVYKVSAVAIEPIAEDNISNFLSEVGNLMTIMLACVIAIVIMFFVTTAVLTSISVVSG